MLTITTFEQKDIENINKRVGYFFEGNGGFLAKNKLPQYSFEYKDDASLLKLSRLLMGSGASDVASLREYIQSSHDQCDKGIAKARVEIEKLEARKLELAGAYRDIGKATTLYEAVETLLNPSYQD